MGFPATFCKPTLEKISLYKIHSTPHFYNIYPQNLTFAQDDIIYLIFPIDLTCFIRGSNRIAGMDGTLGVAPRHAYDTKFASWFVSQQFAATTLRSTQTSWGSVEKRAGSCEKTRALGKRPVLCEYLILLCRMPLYRMRKHTHIHTQPATSQHRILYRSLQVLRSFSTSQNRRKKISKK